MKSCEELVYGELVREGIEKAKQKEKVERESVTVSEMYDGELVSTEYVKKNGAIWQQIIIDGQVKKVNRVYKVNTEKPYTRGFGKRWYLEGEEKEAMRAAVKLFA